MVTRDHAPAASLPDHLGRYEVLREIASGGMATVFLGRGADERGTPRLVALKRLHPHLAQQRDFIEMFMEEARLTARLRHPNVVPTYDVSSDDGHFIAMEYIEGDWLLGLLRHAALEGQPVPTRIAVRIALDTLAGLHAAHELRGERGEALDLIHRDVSPQNVLVGIDGVTRLTDFGIARTTGRVAVTRSGQIKGKISYMAPEQTRTQRIDRRVDLFAMGMIVWEMLAGTKLFGGEDLGEVLRQLLFEPIPTVRQHAPGVAPALDEAVMKALQRDPDARYATAAEFAAALEIAAMEVGGPAERAVVGAYVQEAVGRRLAREQSRSIAHRYAALEASAGFGQTPSAPDLVLALEDDVIEVRADARPRAFDPEACATAPVEAGELAALAGAPGLPGDAPPVGGWTPGTQQAGSQGGRYSVHSGPRLESPAWPPRASGMAEVSIVDDDDELSTDAQYVPPADESGFGSEDATRTIREFPRGAVVPDAGGSTASPGEPDRTWDPSEVPTLVSANRRGAAPRPGPATTGGAGINAPPSEAGRPMSPGPARQQTAPAHPPARSAGIAPRVAVVGADPSGTTAPVGPHGPPQPTLADLARFEQTVPAGRSQAVGAGSSVHPSAPPAAMTPSRSPAFVDTLVGAPARVPLSMDPSRTQPAPAPSMAWTKANPSSSAVPAVPRTALSPKDTTKLPALRARRPRRIWPQFLGASVLALVGGGMVGWLVVRSNVLPPVRNLSTRSSSQSPTVSSTALQGTSQSTFGHRRDR